MSASSGSTLTAEEKIAYPYLFAKADTDQLGVVVGEQAVAFFASSKLPPRVLGEIWQLADQDNAGFLTRPQFDIALRLIGKAQRGLPINKAAVETSGPLPRLEGHAIPGLPAPNSPQPTGNRPGTPKLGGVPSEPAAHPGADLWSISADERAKYQRLFVNAGPKDGLLDGDKARDIFIKSRLPFDKLAQVWNLADSQQRGSLSAADFCIAMHLIQLCMSGKLMTLPEALPPPLRQIASSTVARQGTGQGPMPGTPLHPQATGVRPQVTGVPRQLTGSGASLALGASAFNRSLPPSQAGSLPWDVSQAELAQSNGFFDQLDTARQGFIPGEQAVPFLMESKLPADVLATVWDLADIRGEGKLNREEFAVAMRLIQDKLGGRELPAVLPPSMVPPSLRALPGMPPNGAPELAARNETQRDLLSLLDDDPVPPPASKQSSVLPAALAAQTTGGSITSQSRRVGSPSPSVPLVKSPLGNHAVGRSIAEHHTGGSAGGRGFRDDFSGEDAGAKLGNLQNQLQSTQRATEAFQNERVRLEEQHTSAAAQIGDLELKLAAAKAMHGTEQKLVNDLRSRQVEQSSTLTKLKEDVIRAESDLSALRLEKTELEGSLLRDKEEIRGLKAQMQSLGEEIGELKAQIEKAKKDGRQQKGLLAISKKQLATSEGQRDAAAEQLSKLQLEEPPVEAGADVSPLAPPRSHVASPAISTTSSRSLNPFERLMGGAATSSAEPPLAASSQVIVPAPALEDHVNDREEPDPFAQPLAQGGSFADMFGFDDAFGADPVPAKPIDPVPPNPAANDPPEHGLAAPSAGTKPAPHSPDAGDESSDDESVEDPVASKPSHQKDVDAENKFPALEDFDVPPREAATEKAVPGGLPVDGISDSQHPAPVSPPRDPSKAAAAAQPSSQSPDSGWSFSSLPPPTAVSTAQSATADPTTNASDWDDAFASLPPAQPTAGPAIGDSHTTFQSFDDAAFDDDFDAAFGPTTVPAQNGSKVSKA